MAKKEIEEIKVSNDPLYLAIEEKRTAFAKQFNKQKIINGCVLGATLLAIILTYIFLTKHFLGAIMVLQIYILAKGAIYEKVFDL